MPFQSQAQLGMQQPFGSPAGVPFDPSHSFGGINKPYASSASLTNGFVSDFPNCFNGPLKDNLVCNSSAPWTDRASALVDLFTNDELIANMGNSAWGVERLSLPYYQYWGESLHGLAYCPAVSFADSGKWSYATSFPSPILLGAAFDDDLVHHIATIISNEARAFSNNKHSYLNYWTPNVNPFRDPRWGRGQEVPSEDAFHISRYVYALVTGLQGPDAPDYYKVIASCKHLAVYDLDFWYNDKGQLVTRFDYDAQVSTQELAEYHTLPFRTCVRDALVGSVMCSYNAFNGIPTCANPWLLQDLLRDEWGFGDNWVTGDCDAVLHIAQSHHYVDRDHAAAVALKAGTDTDCGGITQETLGAAVTNGLVTRDDLKQAVYRLYGSLIRAGYFDSPEKQPYSNLGWSDVNTPEAQKLALYAAESGIVLLKNDGLLPLSVDDYKTVALLGPLGDITNDMQGNYVGRAPFLISPLQALKEAGFDVKLEHGTDGVTGDSTDNFQAAIDAAKASSIIIFAGGLTNLVEAEAFDRQNITWPGKQLNLLKELTKLGKPIVVVQFGGGQVDDTELKASSKINSILWAGYPGERGGHAIVNILTGKAAPAGRLPSTQYPGSYIDLAYTDINLRPSSSSPGRTYQWYTGTAVYEFGYGLHYTTFSFSWAKPPPKTFNIATLTTKRGAKFLDNEVMHSFKVKITNTGKVASDYVALLFVKTKAGPQPAPLKSLIGFARAKKIAPGATQAVELSVTLGAIARVDKKGSFVLYPGKYDLELDTGGALKASFNLVGDATEILDFPQQR
ncbi:beta-xylosidase [Auriculariales sp. MPI-PUGE-AT-0066]|nr:beta-xylosidase [Auriculariales sp. MPI-PUGE-AT-0066]